MICNEFRAAFAPGAGDKTLLEHLRSCDACLDHAAHVDPDVMFRALGGADIVPPGGVDAFVGDVMHAVQLRSREGRLEAHTAHSWTRKLAVAAALAVGLTGGTLLYQAERSGASGPVAYTASIRPHVAAEARVLTTKPVVETYSSPNATIVEVPTSGANDVQVVMIFDESLPADL